MVGSELILRYQSVLKTERLELLRLPAVRYAVIQFLKDHQSSPQFRRVPVDHLKRVMIVLMDFSFEPEKWIEDLLQIPFQVSDWLIFQDAISHLPHGEIEKWISCSKQTVSLRGELLENYLHCIKNTVRGSFYAESVELRCDLESVGLWGLVSALEDFDVSKGLAFEKFASWSIYHRLTSWLSKNSQVKLPENVVRQMRAYRKHEEILMKELGRHPTIVEMAARLEVSVDEVGSIRGLFQPITSMDAEMGGDEHGEGSSLHDLLGEPAAEPFDRSDRQLIMDEMLKGLMRLEGVGFHTAALRYAFFHESAPEGTALWAEEAFGWMQVMSRKKLIQEVNSF